MNLEIVCPLAIIPAFAGMGLLATGLWIALKHPRRKHLADCFVISAFLATGLSMVTIIAFCAFALVRIVLPGIIELLLDPSFWWRCTVLAVAAASLWAFSKILFPRR